MQNIVLINKSIIVWSTKILLPFLNSSDNLLHEALGLITFQNGVDNFEKIDKNCSISV